MYVPWNGSPEFPHRNDDDIAWGQKMQAAFEPLLQQYRVDVAIWAHVHTFARTCPLFNNSCVPSHEGGVRHLIVGTGGNALDRLQQRSESKAWVEAIDTMNATKFGFLRFEVVNRSAMRIDYVTTTGVVDVHDTVWVQAPPQHNL